MRVLVTGSTGFLGSALVRALAAAGHAVVPVVHSAGSAGARGAGVAVEFALDHDEERWGPRLHGIDAVVNAVGIFREHGIHTFEALHVAAPVALFRACAAAGIERVVQVSALGADDAAATPFHRSKKRADDALLALIPRACVVQPSLVFGPGGASARMFLALAAAPLVVLPLGGRPCVQPIHVDDLAELVVRLLETDARPQRIAAVGPQPLALRAYLDALRARLGWARALVVPLPAFAARLLGALGLPWLDASALSMLARGNCADAEPVTRVLGRAPRAPAAVIADADVPAARSLALLGLFAPLLKASVALVWIVSGAVSLGIHPVDDSYEMLARSGVPAALAPLALYGAALLDVALGVLMYVLRGRALRVLYGVQLATIVAYTTIITLSMPELWAHPFAPLVKNVPMVVVIALLLRGDVRR